MGNNSASERAKRVAAVDKRIVEHINSYQSNYGRKEGDLLKSWVEETFSPNYRGKTIYNMYKQEETNSPQDIILRFQEAYDANPKWKLQLAKVDQWTTIFGPRDAMHDVIKNGKTTTVIFGIRITAPDFNGKIKWSSDYEVVATFDTDTCVWLSNEFTVGWRYVKEKERKERQQEYINNYMKTLPPNPYVPDKYHCICCGKGHNIKDPHTCQYCGIWDTSKYYN